MSLQESTQSLVKYVALNDIESLISADVTDEKIIDTIYEITPITFSNTLEARLTEKKDQTPLSMKNLSLIHVAAYFDSFECFVGKVCSF